MEGAVPFHFGPDDLTLPPGGFVSLENAELQTLARVLREPDQRKRSFQSGRHFGRGHPLFVLRDDVVVAPAGDADDQPHRPARLLRHHIAAPPPGSLALAEEARGPEEAGAPVDLVVAEAVWPPGEFGRRARVAAQFL